MAAGRAILCLAGRNSELSGFISRNECGYFADAEDIQGIKNAIEILKSDIPYRKKLMENSRNYVLEHFSRDKILNIYEEEISKL